PSGARYATDPRPGTNWSGNAAAQVFLPARARELRPRSLPVGSGLHLFSTEPRSLFGSAFAQADNQRASGSGRYLRSAKAWVNYNARSAEAVKEHSGRRVFWIAHFSARGD